MEYSVIKDAVFYAKEDPNKLATILMGVIESIPKAPTKIVVSSTEDKITIPTDESVTATITATVFDQFGSEMPSRETTLSLADTYTGVTLADGVLTVEKTAVECIVVINATCEDAVGTVSIEIVSAE